jgi:hypothetical protein
VRLSSTRWRMSLERLLGCNSQKIGARSQDGATVARYRSGFNTTSALELVGVLVRNLHPF